MKLIADDPIIRSIERTGYPYWMADTGADDEYDEYDEYDEEDEDDE